MKNSDDTIGNRTHDLLTCGTVLNQLRYGMPPTFIKFLKLLNIKESSINTKYVKVYNALTVWNSTFIHDMQHGQHMGIAFGGLFVQRVMYMYVIWHGSTNILT